MRRYMVRQNRQLTTKRLYGIFDSLLEVNDNAMVFGEVKIAGKVKIFGNAKAYDNAKV